jgi:hypothetical protein
MNELDEALDLLDPNDMQLDQSPTVAKLHPALTIAMVSAIHATMEEDKDASLNHVVYLTAREFVKQMTKVISPDAYLNSVLIHYLEAYRGYGIMQEKLKDNSVDVDDPRFQVLYNEASLALFDLYLNNPHDSTLRRILPLAAHALGDVMLSNQNARKDVAIKDILGHSSSVAIITSNLSKYVKGNRRRKNFDYIRWVRDLLEKVISREDLSFMDEDEILKCVVKQIRARNTVISVA